MRTLGISDVESNSSKQDILASDYPTKQLDIVLGKATGVLLRGCMLGKKTADGKYYAYKDTATDGTEVLDGILAEDIDVSAADEKTYMFIGGEFAQAGLTAASGVTIPTGQFKSGMITIKGSY